jgi:hypothetical protein
MARTRPVNALAGAATVIGMAIVGASGVASAAPRPADALLPGSAVPFTSRTAASGNVSASKRLSIQVWLRPRTAAAQRYAAAVSTPGSRLFHHYLTPAS